MKLDLFARTKRAKKLEEDAKGKAARPRGGFLKYGYPQFSSILMGISLITHPFGVPPFMETSIYIYIYIHKIYIYTYEGFLE